MSDHSYQSPTEVSPIVGDRVQPVGDFDVSRFGSSFRYLLDDSVKQQDRGESTCSCQPIGIWTRFVSSLSSARSFRRFRDSLLRIYFNVRIATERRNATKWRKDISKLVTFEHDDSFVSVALLCASHCLYRLAFLHRCRSIVVSAPPARHSRLAYHPT